MTMPGSVPAAVGRLVCGPDPSVDLRELGEAEVEDLDAARVRDEEVLGLQIPVDDPLVVRGGEAVRDLQRVVNDLALRELAARERQAQRLALEQLLDDVGRVVMRADVVDGRDVGVIENARGLGLLLEAPQRSASCEKDGGSTLIATSRPSRGSFAR